MYDDYRNTKYCPILKDLEKKKGLVIEKVLTDHPRTQDIYKYISNNDSIYKKEFIEAYNGKCAYCGVSIDIIPKRMFEIDHFICKSAKEFKGDSVKASNIDNLVLACYECNRSKGSLEVPDNMRMYLHPDRSGITSTFIRDDQYYIKISEVMIGNAVVENFYSKLKLGAEIHRLDYLLISMRGLKERNLDKPEVSRQLGEAIDVLQSKRNIMG